MVLTTPKPRAKVYGGLAKYRRAAVDQLSRRVTQGEADLRALERDIADRAGVKHAIAMPQARVGLYHVIAALIAPGDKVVMSPYTIHEVVNMVICAGGRPVFADVDRATCNIAPEEVDRLIDDETGAVLVTHLHGLACEVERIAGICRARGVPLVEDAAQSFGGTVNGRWLGAWGDAGVYSFGMAKNVNSFFGGMVVTDRDDLAERLRAWEAQADYKEFGVLRGRIKFCALGELLTLRPLFQSFTYWVFRHGYLNDIEALNKRWRGEDDPQIKHELPQSYLKRLTPMQARIARSQLDDVEADNQERIGYARMYFNGLSNLPGCTVPPFRDDGSQIYLAYPLQVEDRHALLRYLMRNKRDLTVQHIRNNADSPVYGDYYRDCPNARAAGDGVLLLPTYPGYGEAEVRRNIELIRAYFDR